MYNVLNNSIEFFGARFITRTANILESVNVDISQERLKLFLEVFDQFMLFDNIIVKTSADNLPLLLLIEEFGLNKTEELIEKGQIKFLIWIPYLLCEIGIKTGGPIVRIYGSESAEDTYDDSRILGTTPLIVSDRFLKDLDIEKSLDKTLSILSIHPDRKRILKKRVLANYIIPDIKDAQNSKDFVYDAYNKDSLKNYKLEYSKELNELGTIERQKLLKIAYEIFDTTLLTNYQYKHYSDYNFMESINLSYNGLANALKVKENVTEIFKIENIPDFSKLFVEEKLTWKKAFDLRQLSNAKYFRKWINSKSESVDSIEITKEYLNEIKGDSKFFNKNGGKFLKTMGLFGIGAGLGSAISGVESSLIGGALGVVSELGLSLIDTYWLDRILIGKNPSLFIKDLERFKIN
jgi:hypothetical protein